MWQLSKNNRTSAHIFGMNVDITLPSTAVCYLIFPSKVHYMLKREQARESVASCVFYTPSIRRYNSKTGLVMFSHCLQCIVVWPVPFSMGSLAAVLMTFQSWHQFMLNLA